MRTAMRALKRCPRRPRVDAADVNEGHTTFTAVRFSPSSRENKPSGWDEIYASHTFHEIQMYYPMRVVRTRTHKLIWNIAHPLPYPFASDLWAAPSWQAQFKLGPQAPYGKRTVNEYIHRPMFELHDIVKDPHEGQNLAGNASFAKLKTELIDKMKAFQKRTEDPWILKWKYE